MSLEENKAKVRRVIAAVINGQNLDLLDDLSAPDYFDHTHQLNLEGVKQFMNMLFEAFPDWHETIEDIVAEGDRVWHRFTTTGTHTGEFVFGGMTLPPTGKKFTMTGVNFWRIVDGKVVEKGGLSDQLDFLQKSGIIKYTEEGKKLFPEDVS